MKRFIYTFILLCSVFISAHSENVASLVISHADGTTTSYPLFNKPSITFIGDSVKISSQMGYVEYLAKDVLRLIYIIHATAINNTTADNELKNDGEYLTFGGNVKEGNVKVFTSDGIEVATKFTTTAGGLRLSLSSLKRGIYLININGITSKFMKR